MKYFQKDLGAPKPMLSDRLYDVLNAIVKYVLPASGTLYFTLAAIWNLMYAEQIVGTIAAVTTFLAVILALSKRSYKLSQINKSQ